jgi:hypothetical protein
LALAQEPGQRVALAPRRPQQLDRHRRAGGRVDRLDDHAERAGAERARHLKALGKQEARGRLGNFGGGAGQHGRAR